MKRSFWVTKPLASVFFAMALASCHTKPQLSDSAKSFSEDSVEISTFFSKTKINRDSSAFYISEAKAIVHRSHSVSREALFLTLQGKEYIYSGNLDSALGVINRGLSLNLDSSLLYYRGRFYNLMGQVQGFRKNGYNSIDCYLKAEKIFSAINDSSSLAGTYSNVANTYFSLKDYATANLYALKAYKLRHTVKEKNNQANVITTYALSLIKTGQTAQALRIEAEADSVATVTNNVLAKLASTIGFAEIYKSMHRLDTAISYYEKCMLLSRKAGVKHFELMSRVGLMFVYEELQAPNKIVSQADSTLLLAQQLNNTDVLHTVKRLLGRAYAEQHKFQTAYRYLNESYVLYDSLSGIENQKNINELLIKYDSKHKENEILNQKYLLEKQTNELKARQFLIFMLLAGFASLLILVLYIKKLSKEKVKRIELEKQKGVNDAYIIGEENERKRISFEIHDGVSSMITAIILKLKNTPDGRTDVIDMLKQLHIDSRRISYNLRPLDFDRESLLDAVENLCSKVSNSQIDVSFATNMQTIGLDNKKAAILYRIIQELINNALKHSGCKSVFVTIKEFGNRLQTRVQDDGVGMSSDTEIEQGLKTVKERVAALNATIEIETNSEEGTTITIEHDNA